MSNFKYGMSNFESVEPKSNHSIKKMSVMNKQDPLVKLHSHARDYLQTDYEDNCLNLDLNHS